MERNEEQTDKGSRSRRQLLKALVVGGGAAALTKTQLLPPSSASAQTAGTAGGWDLRGNSATVPGTNFVGTTDAQPLVIKTSGVERMRIASNGNVGIGTTSLTFGRLTIEDPWVPLSFRETGQPVDQGGLWRMPLDGGSLRFDVNTGAPGQEFGSNCRTVLSMGRDGNVGIGTTSLTFGRLTIEDPWVPLSFRETGQPVDQGGLWRMPLDGGSLRFDVNTGAPGQEFGSNCRTVLSMGRNGNVGIGVVNPATRLHVNGTTRTKILEITGGSDLAERFEVESDIAVEPGTLMVIDPAYPGKLKMSDQSYDRKVAGIVSGAGGVKPGLTLHQEGTLEGAHTVAMAGRVYVKAEATSGAIQPGDMLTTSTIPGHAMRVGDSTRENGAIVGKAMTRLDEGTGLVLVLVNLQ